VEPRGLSREVVPLGEAWRRSGSIGIQACCGHRVTITLVQVCCDGNIAGQGRIELCQGGQASPWTGGLPDRLEMLRLVVAETRWPVWCW
jgi:hypothetical protein